MRNGHARWMSGIVGLVVVSAFMGCGGTFPNDLPSSLEGGGIDPLPQQDGEAEDGGIGAEGSRADSSSGYEDFDGSGRPRRDGGAWRGIFDGAFHPDVGVSNPDCPVAMPSDEDPCGPATTCRYASGGCTCQHQDRDDAGRYWHCQQFPTRDGGNAMTCTAVRSGEMCDQRGYFCNNGSQTCVCFGTGSNDRKWECY